MIEPGLLRRSLRLQAGEFWAALALTAHCFCVVGGFVVGRSARDTLFLERAPSTWLPWMYLASAACVTLVGLGYGRLADRLRRDRMAAASATALGGAILGLWALLGSGGVGTRVLPIVIALYVVVEIAGALAVMQLWTLANDAYNPREARRIFPVVVSGGIVANIVCGFTASWLARHAGTLSLLVFCGLLFGGAALLSLLEGRLLPLAETRGAALGRPRRAAAEKGGTQAPPALFRDGHLRAIAALLVITFLTTTLIDYQFKLTARAAFQGRSLAEFFGNYYAWTGFLGLGVQLLVTRRVLDRLGLLGALAILPFGLGLGTLAFLGTRGALWAAAVAQGSNVTFRYTVNDSVVQLLYLPLSPRIRGRAKALIEGIGKPASIGAAAAFLLVYQRAGLGLGLLSWVALALIVAWMLLLWRTRGSYVSLLEQTLRRRDLSFAGAGLRGEGEAAQILRRALTSPVPSEVAHALELLPSFELPEIEETLVLLLRHPDGEVRRLAVEQISARRGLRHGNLVYQLFEDPDPKVRAEAVRAFCGMAREKAVRSVRPFLTAPEVLVRAAAVAGLVRHGGLDGILTAGPVLQQLLRGPTADERRSGARALGEIGVRTFYQPLLGLLGDPELSVRREALRAAAQLRSHELVPALIYRLGEPAIASDAADALAALGREETLSSEEELGPARAGTGTKAATNRLELTLGLVLRNSLEDPRIRANVPRVLSRLGTPLAARVLLEALELSDEALRGQIVAALARLRRAQPTLALAPEPLGRALARELSEVEETLACLRALGLPTRARPGEPDRAGEVAPPLASGEPLRRPAAAGAGSLLDCALDEQRRRALGRLLGIVGLLHPRIGAQGLRVEALLSLAGGPDAARRAATLELLDNLLPRPLRTRLLPLWERGDAGGGAPQKPPSGGGQGSQPLEYLERLASSASPWVQACALWYLGCLGDPAQAPLAERALRSEQPRVREAALLCLTELTGPPPRSTLDPLLRDPDRGVRAAAERSLARLLAPAIDSQGAP